METVNKNELFSKEQNQNTEYEKLAQYIYQCILLAEGFNNIIVEHNVNKLGKSGCEHQIDVYWEFTVGGVTQKVAIECKNYSSVVSIGKVRDFFGVLNDVGNITGIFVTKIGYQSGARKYADYYGISLKEIRYPNQEDWKGKLKTLQVDVHILPRNVKKCNIELDYEWMMNEGKISKPDEFQNLHFKGLNGNIWLFDRNGNRITNFFELKEKLPHEMQPEKDKVHVYDYDDAFIEVGSYGKIKIKRIVFEYDIDDIQSQVIIDAETITKAIIKDVKSGQIKFITKDGTLK
jgi:hypothetical protein